ncbi:hypothetical protein PAQ31011_05155 [Pandoraea aquatica]|uniref:Uncharacterized protein n=1 Tax=Pandoraea aquatica TaxID=2508290 RepID=A0A5E4Z991_9BURK|nr:hypothetical protein [Pandoraea aquatica]VVE56890.1 hypothetical protein PAQ31011_05155 [Pandoraea aquatica]
MAIAFDKQNLDAAVAAVMKSALEKEQKWIPQLGGAVVRLTEDGDVRSYLMARASEAYTQAAQLPGGIQVARIEGVPYSPVGFVFEPHVGEMLPAPVRIEGDTGEVQHLAYFWAVL